MLIKKFPKRNSLINVNVVSIDFELENSLRRTISVVDRKLIVDRE